MREGGGGGFKVIYKNNLLILNLFYIIYERGVGLK